MIKLVSKLEPENKQPDLLYIRPILVTSGQNANDIMMLPQELFAAVKTPLFKPVDWEHHGDENDPASEIIGTIIASWFEDLDGNKLEHSNFSDMPTEFNIVTDAVVWQFLYSDRAKEIETRFKNNKLFCSMETWFSSYDYAIKHNDNYKIVTRNKTTSSLDKYIKYKGGDGKVNGSRIFMVPRNLTFGGLGIVEKPANKRSEIKDLQAQQSLNIEAKITVISNEKILLPDATEIFSKIAIND